jgi:5-methyltetrahydrofolate--homocysteine methyltransferase
METRVSSATKEVIIGHGHPTVLIGERINPTGKKRMSEALRAGDLEIVREEVLSQVQAGAVGIPPEDIIIDCLALAVAADPRSGLVILETIGRIKAELGVNLTLGVSNISFGLPDRNLLNSASVAMVIAAGVTCLIVDVAKVRPTVLAADLLLNQDAYARRYIGAYRERQQRP